MSVQKHIHKLKRHKYKNGTLTYFCVNDCDYRLDPELAFGKIVECWRCARSFSMNVYSSKSAKPHCEECHKFKGDLAKKIETKPLQEIAVLAGEDITNDLADRLHSLTEPIKTVEFKQLENEEDLL